ncbi:transposase [Actinobaculum suis]|uniref:transposase n=1 Tax=Actinobaculum suis TaxID=1657 RepID=UPI0011462EE7|nr:transposase [Actinobaculum suis]
MSRKIHSAQFRKDAVAAYESSEASMAQIASGPGINCNSLQEPVNQFGTDVRTSYE